MNQIQSNNMETEAIIFNQTEHLRDIIRIVLGVDVRKAKSRHRHVVNARMIYSYILHKLGFGYSSIGRAMVKHHATVMHYVKNFDNYLMSDPELRRSYIEIKNSFDVDSIDQLYLSEDELKKELILLRKENKSLSLKIIELEEKLISTDSREKRLGKIYKIVDERTKLGFEEESMWAINRLYNNLYDGI